jgi:Cellulase (glycosyl hydrolase family 5)
MSPAIRRRALGACVATLVLLVNAAPAGSSSARPAGTSPTLTLGFFDGVFLGKDGATWLQRAAAAGSDVVRIDIGWVAPNGSTKPAGFNARNPADPNYDFTSADAAVREATGDGMRVILDITGAPQWAEGPNMPASATPGSWRPNPADVEQYAVALATRYSGRFPDPANPGHMLPRVWAFQLWNEPNLSTYLAPQWVGNHTEAPILYRAMLNAFYTGIKSVDPGALVVTAGTAPFGDPEPGGQRIMPARFWRDVLCVQQVGSSLRGGKCSRPAHFDVLAHHPYSVGPPQTKAINADDVSIPDIWKLTAILRASERAGDALPHIHHPIWVTETGYNTRPPNPNGIPVVEQARWLEQTFQLLWKQGVSLITWNTIVDQPPVPSYATTSQSGVYYLDGKSKPSLQAFHLPIVATRVSHSRMQVWVRTPARGELTIQALKNGAWQRLAGTRACAGCVSLIDVPDPSPMTVRAQLGSLTGLAYDVP